MLAEAAAAAQDYLTSPSVLADQITAAGATAWLIQKLKVWPQFKWLDKNSTSINRLVSIGMAFATSVGIHCAWQGNAEHGGVFTLNLPPFQEILSLIWRTGGSFVMQELVYQGVIKHQPGKEAADTVAEVVNKRKEELAAVVVQEAVKQDSHSILKLGHTPDPACVDEAPIDWHWDSGRD